MEEKVYEAEEGRQGEEGGRMVKYRFRASSGAASAASASDLQSP